MSELESLVKNLSDKFDGLQNDLDDLKCCSGKRKKHRRRHSRQHRRRHSSTRSGSRSSSGHREGSHSWREIPTSLRERSRSRSASPPHREPRDCHNRDGSRSPTREDELPTRTRHWEDIPNTPQYNEVVEWEYNSGK